MSLDDVARVTKIQPRILERLETGRFDGLPAEVFVRGFVRSFARCVGLDEREALRRYAACAIGSQDLTPTVRALVEAMADLAPGSANAARATPRKMQAVEVIDLASPVVLAPPPAVLAAGAEQDAASEAPPGAEPDLGVAGVPCVASVATAVEPPGPDAQMARASEPVIESTIEPVAAVAEPAPSSEPAAGAPPVQSAGPGGSKKKRERRRKARAAAREAAAAAREPVATEAQASPVAAARVESPRSSASAPWRRLARRVSAAPAAPTRPSLVIDDADPESAERMQDERADGVEAMAPRRSFLPPILLDREDRSARQGGLTLAVILLLIAATLTLSYLMRRPSASGDGMTGREAPVLRVDTAWRS
jgi:hypothetical protein